MRGNDRFEHAPLIDRGKAVQQLRVFTLLMMHVHEDLGTNGTSPSRGCGRHSNPISNAADLDQEFCTVGAAIEERPSK